MLSSIDTILFPERCEIIQLGNSQRCVYPIMKNGSSSFYSQIYDGVKPDWQILTQQDKDKITFPLITFIRNPRSRFVSGVNTYLQHLQRDYSQLDYKTILWFVDRYLFLNRHYCPQFFWLVNLARWFGRDVAVELKSMDDVHTFAGIDDKAMIKPPTREFVNDIKDFDWKKLEIYFFLDQILVDLIGQTVTFEEILNKVKQQPALNELVLAPTFNLTNVLR